MAATIDGKEATFISECKPTINQAGIVFLGADWADTVPPIEFEHEGQTTILEGFSNDPELFKLYDKFGKACRNGTFDQLVAETAN